ncbi:ethanolamine kinase 1-like isoform X3 [Artemia franciscana]|uniref:ethanolamine kinase n=3 Tax=Artemia franciscana TaxID=6661 RepID=A0AA88I4I6_ARTSF|nr:hypothetical protein QYM36_006762 [Artemia franciscana]
MNKVAMNVNELSFKIEEHDLIPGSLHIVHSLRPSWKLENVNVKVFKNGITNKLLGIYEKCDTTKEDMILIRVYGSGTSLMIDRQVEIRNIQRLYEAGCGSKLYAIFKNGLAYEYVKGKVLDTASCRSEKVYPHVAEQLAKFHTVPLKINEGTSILWDKMRLFLSLKPSKFLQEEQQERFLKKVLPKNELEREISLMEGILSKLGSPIVFCHNDLLLANILYDAQGCAVSFIDFEYAGPNYMAFDIANHFNEFAGVDTVDYSLYPSDEFQIEWLKVYLRYYKSLKYSSENISIAHEEVTILCKHVNLFSLASHFFWALWALVQATQSTIDFDFLGYAIVRFDEYFSKKKLLLVHC